MAKRPVFKVEDGPGGLVSEQFVEFEWHPGFAASQKQKNILSLHSQYQKLNIGHKVLEISTKSSEPLGVAHSAFNLRLIHEGVLTPLECVYQGSKVFKSGGPFTDLYKASPIEAKKDLRIKEAGPLQGFYYDGEDWPLKPQSFFYDWLYLNAIKDNGDIVSLSKFDGFTDIEFNPNKSISCQARTAAMAVALYRRNNEYWLPGKSDLMSYYKASNNQGSLF